MIFLRFLNSNEFDLSGEITWGTSKIFVRRRKFALLRKFLRFCGLKKQSCDWREYLSDHSQIKQATDGLLTRARNDSPVG